jgi:hypothetical protein
MRLILWIMPNDKESYSDLGIEYGGVGGVAGGGPGDGSVHICGHPVYPAPPEDEE